MGCGVVHDETILGRAAGMSGPDREGQVVEQVPLAILHRLLDQPGGWPTKADHIRVDAQITQVHITHGNLPSRIQVY